ncbi:MAG: extracellular solute-binding protein [Thermodesulfobacteriota bacterium]
MKMRSFANNILFICMLLVPGYAHAGHGVSIDGILKYPANFSHFDYVSPDARKGGDLVLHALGSFDKFNPYTLKGVAPDGMNELVFETLTINSMDETFARYSLIAKDIELAADKKSILFTLDSRARFSDGSPVTAEDVKFSLETLKSGEAHPFFSSYFQDISHAEILSPRQIRFYFARPNREIHMIACELPVFSKKFYSAHPFNEKGLVPPIASGPYTVENFSNGKSITFKRNPDYWAFDHPTRRGMFNFESITFKFFKDQIVSVEAFKAGDFDFMQVNIAKQWARDMKGGHFETGAIQKKYLEHKRNAGMQGFVFNTRKPIFTDPRVREALVLAFDFSWTNNSLFFGQYQQSYSYFSNSIYAAPGLPSQDELKLLSPFKELLPAEVFNKPLTPVSTAQKGNLRNNLRKAKALLKQAGWSYKDGVLRNDKGEPFIFEIMLASPSFERVMAPYARNLEKLGIQASYRTIDVALYIRNMRTFDYDMTVYVFGQSQSPGNEQRDMWGSAAVDQNGSRNYAGVKSEVVDALVDKIIYATSQNELTTACRALDRVLWYGYYVVPNWFAPAHRVVYWNKFNRPEQEPLYYSPFEALMTWWFK